MRRFRKIVLLACAAYMVLAMAAGIYVAEASLHLHRRPLLHQQEFASEISRDFHANLERRVLNWFGTHSFKPEYRSN